MPSVTPGSWTCHPQTHRGGVHCRWPVTKVVGGISPSASLWTCIVAGESAGNSVSYYHIHVFFSTFLTPHPNRRFLELRVKEHSTADSLPVKEQSTAGSLPEKER